MEEMCGNFIERKCAWLLKRAYANFREKGVSFRENMCMNFRENKSA